MSGKDIVVDQGHWRHLAICGEDRVRFLNGMVTGNIKTLKAGDWLRCLMLTHKARVISIFDVHVREEDILLSCSPELFDNTYAILDKHIVMDDVELEEESTPMHTVWSCPEDVWTAAPIFAETPLISGPQSASQEDIECMRIEAGMPKVGVDVSEDNFPFESLLVRYVDYEKGCFTGQEPVARVHARGGGGSKRLCGLRARGDELLEPGSVLSTSEKKAGGKITSAVLSPRLGSIALAYVHKSAWEIGTNVKIGDRVATVATLPFDKGN